MGVPTELAVTHGIGAYHALLAAPAATEHATLTRVHILMSTVAPETAHALGAALEAAGHEVLSWHPGQPVPASAQLALVEGLEGVIEARELPCDIVALVSKGELRLFPECPRDVVDFVVSPWDTTEVVARVRRLASEPSRRERTHQRLLAAAVEHASDIIELTSPAGVVEYVNAAYQRTTGRAATSLVGALASQMREGSDGAEQLVRGEAWSGTLLERREDDEQVHLDATVSPLTDAKGLITHHMAVKRDITARLATQAALEQANAALQQAHDDAVAASRAKSEFLANMSHELRTPLNAIIGYTEMVLEELGDDDQNAEDLSAVLTAARNLLQLINDLLDVAKIEANKVSLAPETVSLEELVTEVVASLEPLARRNDNRMQVQLDGGPREIHTDRRRLMQVMRNLLSNACKFTENGEVRVEAATTSREGEPWFELRVHDTGIGISEEQQARLFRPFAQADGSATRRFGGSGLGLVISRRLCELMGGDIALSSEPGVGSTFTVQLPLRYEAA
jgi:PAS domain S-box-containing protein